MSITDGSDCEVAERYEQIDASAGKDKITASVSAGLSDLLGEYVPGSHFSRLRLDSPEVHGLCIRELHPG